MSAEQHTQFNANISPETEDSLFKQIPVNHAEEAKQIARNMFPDRKVRVRYRGPRYDSMRLTCLKRNARSVAIYVDQ
jgi:hemolysin-activating ACP:hemolysin acyltransferase